MIDVAGGTALILEALNKQIAHGPYASEPVYGDGNAGVKIAETLAAKTVEIQKLITY